MEDETRDVIEPLLFAFDRNSTDFRQMIIMQTATVTLLSFDNRMLSAFVSMAFLCRICKLSSS